MLRGKYGTWKEEDMERALTALRSGEFGLNKCAKAFKVPKVTLKRRLDGINMNAVEHKKYFGRLADLPTEVEKDLVQHVLLLEENFFGLTRIDLCKLAFQIAEQNSIPHRFNKETKMAGNKWYYNFLRRNPQISLRSPEPTSLARAKGFSKDKVQQFFQVLENIIDGNNFQAINIYNMDETGLSTVHKPQKILAKKGKHQVGAITSGERGINTTCICCMSAAGIYVPPMLIFKRIRYNEELERGAPPGTAFACSESGWINAELFVKWLNHFIKHVRPNKGNKVLLILDGHYSHTRNLEAIELARENGIIMLSLPAHTTHRLQPLDVGFLKPLSTYYNQACDQWLRRYPTKTISQFHISELLGASYGRAATVENAVNAFGKTGIWPVNQNVFQDCDFAPSSTITADENLFSRPEIYISGNSSQTTQSQDENMSQQKQLIKANDISPLPRADKNYKRRKTSTNSVQIITSSPYKNQLNEKKTSTKTSTKKPSKKRGRKMEVASSSSWYCKICKLSEERGMIQCTTCKDWAHEDCAQVSPNQKSYTCPLFAGNCKNKSVKKRRGPN